MTRPSRVLVAFIDALGPMQLEAAASSFAFAPHRGAVEGVFGYSSGAIATVLTGEPERGHGRMCLFASSSADPGPMSPLAWLGLLPRWIHERGRVRRAVAKLFAACTDNTGYVALHKVPPAAFRWLDLPERDDIFGAASIGGHETFLEKARRERLRVATARWQDPEPERFAALERTVRRAPPDLTFAYCAGLDGALHTEGNGGPRGREAARAIGAHIQRLRDALSREADVTTIIVGDHGMADVARFVDPRGLVAALGGTRVFVDSTLLRVWGSPNELEVARAKVLGEGWPGTWLDGSDLDAREAPTSGAPYGNAIFVLEEGAIFAPSWVGGRARGMHGYDLGGASTRAAVASDRALPASLTKLTGVRNAVESALGMS
ncbi:MAG: hypothetical protein HOW73_02200 [Polyangiaceae bacterium]|nr:hypothetical protein [Polyangiaceae bacterium]